MFKWIGLIIGGFFAAQYFSLLPVGLNEYFASPDIFTQDERLADREPTEVGNTQAAVVDVVTEVTRQALQITEQTQQGLKPDEKLQTTQTEETDESVVIPAIKSSQLIIWQPFANRYSALGMAKSLSKTTGIAIDVMSQSGDHVLVVSYQSESERSVIVEQLHAVLGNDVSFETLSKGR